MFFNTPEYIFCPEKNVSHHTRHTTCSAPNFDENVPHTCPCTGNPELWQAVHFSTRYVCMNENTKIKENDKTEERLIEKTREIVLSTPAAKKNERKLRAIHPLSTSPFVRTVRVRRDLYVYQFFTNPSIPYVLPYMYAENGCKTLWYTAVRASKLVQRYNGGLAAQLQLMRSP